MHLLRCHMPYGLVEIIGRM